VRLAWFSPLPPMPSGIADYTTEIVPYVAAKASVDVYCPRPSRFRRPRTPDGATLRDPSEFPVGDYDGVFYHLGNNPHHEYIYLQARRRPEIAVFHDAVLHHLIAHATIEAGGDAGRYEGILYGEYGERGRRLATLRRDGIATDYEKFLFPLTAHVAHQARGIVVHSHDAAERIHEQAPKVPMAVIPHHAGEPPPEVAGIDRAEARRRLKLPPDAFVVGHFGFITRPKQPAAVVNGFWALHQEFPDSVLLMVGADHTGGALGRLIDQVDLHRAVRMAGYVDLEKFYVYLRACDAIINLRYPTAGESSGTLARSLAEGRAVVVNNYASWAELPSDVALKVEIDGPQAEQVGRHLLHLADDPEFRAGVEERSRRYAREFLDPNRCRDQYLAFAREVGGREGAGTAIEPAHHEPGRPLTWGEAQSHLGRVRSRIDRVSGATLGQDGALAYVDLLYRTVLRRPAETEALRHAHAELAFGGKLTRAGMARRLFTSREFQEVLTVEQILRERAHSSHPFTIPAGEHLPAPNTTERVVEIPWTLSRYEGEQRVLDLGYAFASGVYLSALLDMGIPALHGLDIAVLSVPGMHRVAADARVLPYRDRSFDLVLCVSTIEHLGLDNTRYGLPFEQRDPGAPLRSLKEIARVLAPGGRLVLSIPFGRREERGWMFQHDADSWEELVGGSPLTVVEQETFRLDAEGWGRVNDLRAMGLLSYGDEAPAAKGVLCAVLTPG
jgi:glycosyltransferase involved in cell wall biosynthesis/SAM-dependent methyltransferase